MFLCGPTTPTYVCLVRICGVAWGNFYYVTVYEIQNQLRVIGVDHLRSTED